MGEWTVAAETKPGRGRAPACRSSPAPSLRTRPPLRHFSHGGAVVRRPSGSSSSPQLLEQLVALRPRAGRTGSRAEAAAREPPRQVRSASPPPLPRSIAARQAVQRDQPGDREGDLQRDPQSRVRRETSHTSCDTCPPSSGNTGSRLKMPQYRFTKIRLRSTDRDRPRPCPASAHSESRVRAVHEPAQDEPGDRPGQRDDDPPPRGRRRASTGPPARRTRTGRCATSAPNRRNATACPSS